MFPIFNMYLDAFYYTTAYIMQSALSYVRNDLVRLQNDLGDTGSSLVVMLPSHSLFTNLVHLGRD